MNKELKKIIERMTEQEFNNWVMSWLSVDWVLDIIEDWDEETQINEVELLNKKVVGK